MNIFICVNSKDISINVPFNLTVLVLKCTWLKKCTWLNGSSHLLPDYYLSVFIYHLITINIVVHPVRPSSTILTVHVLSAFTVFSATLYCIYHMPVLTTTIIGK